MPSRKTAKPLLSDCLTAGGENAGKHQGGRRTETPPRYHPRSAQDDALRFARICYDHLAGRLGVAIADALVRKRDVVLSDEGGELTVAGKRFLSGFGSVIMPASGSRHIFADPAWIGASGAITLPATWAPKYAVAVRTRRLVRQQGSRAIGLTAVGRRGLRQVFGMEPPDIAS